MKVRSRPIVVRNSSVAQAEASCIPAPIEGRECKVRPFEAGKQTVPGLFDTVLCWYNCAMPEPEELLFPHAIAHNTGVVIMNATRTDKLLDGPDVPPIAGFYRYVLAHPAVSVVLRGLRSVERFEEVARALAEREALTPEERRELEAYGAAMRAAGKLD